MNQSDKKNDHDKQEHWIHYQVDGEPESTLEKALTPNEIMRNAGIDHQTHYLEEIKGHEIISFKDKPDVRIDMHNGMRFITKPLRPMSVS